MDAKRTVVFLLFVLQVPVSCMDLTSNSVYTCYCLDGILIIYCIVLTALFLKEKNRPYEPVEPEDKDRIYEELMTRQDADLYHRLEPSKKRKQARRKTKPEGDNETPSSAPPPALSAP